MAKVNLPLGIDSFEKLRMNKCYYIDKTEFIEELLSEIFDVNLITRPRRFGKTLVMSMLAEFLDIRKDSRKIFEGLKVAGNREFCEKWMNQWPVLFLTLKDVDGDDFEDAYGMIQFVIASLCGDHSYLLDSEKVLKTDQRILSRLMEQNGNKTDIKTSLFVLIRMMKAHYGKPVIVLIDEYDVPLAKASDNGYYTEMLNIVQSLLGMAWKSNPSLKFAVVTGCLRIAKESIFTGANNFISDSISDKKYSCYFGFTEQEVLRFLADTGLEECLPEMKKWYDGYRFGEREVYCPWDVVNHVRELMKDIHAKPANYWKNTSHNSIIRKFIDFPGIAVNDKFEILLAGGVIWEPVKEDLTYDMANSSEDHLWSILYLTGYLTPAGPDELSEEKAEKPAGRIKNADQYAPLRIPNEEVKTIFADTVAKWFADTVMARDRRGFFQEWWNGEAELLTKEITDILFETISYFDYREDYYHAFMAGLFLGAGYEVSSNSEQGTGRADIVVKDRKGRRAIIIEVKRSLAEGEMEKDCNRALAQIEEKQYTKKLQIQGYGNIFCYGAAFYMKSCLIKMNEKMVLV